MTLDQKISKLTELTQQKEAIRAQITTLAAEIQKDVKGATSQRRRNNPEETQAQTSIPPQAKVTAIK